MKVSVILTDSVISASGSLDGKPVFVSIPSSHPMYAKMVNAYKHEEYEKILVLGNIAKQIEAFSNGLFFIKDDKVWTRDAESPMPNCMSNRVIDFAKKDLPVKPLVEFWNKLSNHMSENVRNQLYSFLEHNNIPLTQDGNFVCYKKVTLGKDGNLWDSHTFNTVTGVGTFRNNLDDEPSMSRSDVVDDPTQTCSRGLHVAAFEYAKGFSGDTLIHVEVNPIDVVSVPNDYNGQKMRVCKYKVVDVCETEQHTPIQDDIYNHSEDDEDYDDEDDEWHGDDDHEKETDTLDSVLTDTMDTVELRPRADGRVCIPYQYLNFDIVKLVVMENPDNTKYIKIEPCHYDDGNAKVVTADFRIPKTILKNADMFGVSPLILEISDTSLTLSIR